jgi:hypothetical protein
MHSVIARPRLTLIWHGMQIERDAYERALHESAHVGQNSLASRAVAQTGRATMQVPFHCICVG